MITDRRANAGLYRHLHPRIATALDWLSATDLATVPLGKTPIDGENNLAVVQEYTPSVLEPYDAERDVAFFSGTASFIRVPAGSFAIFSPEDVHMPGVAAEGDDAAGTVRKIVVKVRGGQPPR